MTERDVERDQELVTLQEALEMLRTTRTTLYRWLRSGRIQGIKMGRQWRFHRTDLERFLRGQEPRVELPADITPLLAILGERLREAGMEPREPAPGQELETVVNRMALLGITLQASDIHLDPQVDRSLLRLRIDGLLQTVLELDLRLQPALAARWKIMAACDPHETERPQDGRILLRVTTGEGDETRPLDLRVSILPSGRGEAVTVRILDTRALVLDLDRLGYSPAVRERLDAVLADPWGMVVCSGPTGSGKTTLLYACAQQLNRPENKLLTLEDPIEYFLDGAVQVQVRESVGLTFPRALKAAMRSDPDVVLIGEIRDPETLIGAQQAALTGHMVLTTLHTQSAVSGLQRMVDISQEPIATAEAVKLVVAQRLVRRLCTHCREAQEPDMDRFGRASRTAWEGGLNWDDLPRRFHQPVGCDRCGRTGFRGRTVVAEALLVTREIGVALARGLPGKDLQALALEQGMVTMAADAVRLAAEGVTSLEEVLRVTGLA